MKHLRVKIKDGTKRYDYCSKCGNGQYEKGYVVLGVDHYKYRDWVKLRSARGTVLKTLHIQHKQRLLCGVVPKNPASVSVYQRPGVPPDEKICTSCVEAMETADAEQQGWVSNVPRCTKCHAPATYRTYEHACGGKEGLSTPRRCRVTCKLCLKAMKG